MKLLRVLQDGLLQQLEDSPLNEKLIREATAQCRGKRKQVARELGISRSNLSKRRAQMLVPDTAG